MTSDRGVAGWLALGLLLDEPSSGYDLWHRAERSVAHFWPVTRSALYAELPRLEQRGFTTSTEVAQRAYPSKRIYTVTELGRSAFVQWLTGAELTEQPRHPQQLLLFFAAHAPAEYARQLLVAWRSRIEHTVEHCREILGAKGYDPDDAKGDIPHDPRLLTALFGFRRARADIAFLDEIAPVIAPPGSSTEPIAAQLQ